MKCSYFARILYVRYLQCGIFSFVACLKALTLSLLSFSIMYYERFSFHCHVLVLVFQCSDEGVVKIEGEKGNFYRYFPCVLKKNLQIAFSLHIPSLMIAAYHIFVHSKCNVEYFVKVKLWQIVSRGRNINHFINLPFGSVFWYFFFLSNYVCTLVFFWRVIHCMTSYYLTQSTFSNNFFFFIFCWYILSCNHFETHKKKLLILEDSYTLVSSQSKRNKILCLECDLSKKIILKM